MRPMKFFMVHWRAGSLGAVRDGRATRSRLPRLLRRTDAACLRRRDGQLGIHGTCHRDHGGRKWPSLGRKVSMPLGIVLLVAGALVMITSHSISPLISLTTKGIQP